MDLLATSLKTGSTRYAMMMASTSEKTAISVDSVRNWNMRNFLSVPSTLRIPTSLARLAERAVVRFMKLMQAINRINKATAEKIYTYWILPLGLSSKERSEYK